MNTSEQNARRAVRRKARAGKRWRPPEDDARVGRVLGLSTTHTGPVGVRWVVEIPVGGQLLVLRENGQRGGSNKSFGKRSRVAGLTRDSRRRLQRWIAQIDQESAGLPLFVTLTYPREWPGDPLRWKRDLKVVLQRVAREFPEAWGLWRLEPQVRGAPHYHLLLWSVERIPKEWLSCVWFEVVGSQDERHLRAGTQVQRVKEWRGVMAYVSKYLAKTVEDLPAGWDHVGRWWGVHRRELVRSRVSELALTDGAGFRLRRSMRRLRDGPRSRGIRNKWKSSGGATVFIRFENACRLVEYATRPRREVVRVRGRSR